MSLEFPGGPLQTLKCVKKSQKCLFTEKKKLSHRFWSFLVWRYPLWRNLETQNLFALGPLGGVLWAFQILPFLANFWITISWHLQMIEGWFWNQTSSFGMNFLKKYVKFFLAQKSHFLAKRGPFWVPVTPSTMKFEILTPHVIFTSNLC